MKSSRYTRPVKAEKPPVSEEPPPGTPKTGNMTDDSLKTIIGAVIGVVVVALLVVFVIVVFIKRLVFEKGWSVKH